MRTFQTMEDIVARQLAHQRAFGTRGLPLTVVGLTIGRLARRSGRRAADGGGGEPLGPGYCFGEVMIEVATGGIRRSEPASAPLAHSLP